MNVLIFTRENAKTLIEHQSGQHRLAPLQLRDGRWFLMEDILTELPEGLFRDKLNVTYEVELFASIQPLMPMPGEFLSAGDIGDIQLTTNEFMFTLI